MLQERPGQSRGGAGSAQANNVRRVASINTEAANMKEIRRFLSTWHSPTLVLYSDSSLLPWAQHGDFVVGRRMNFYTNLIPGVVRVRRVGGEVGHLVMWDDPHQVVQEIQHFLRY